MPFKFVHRNEIHRVAKSPKSYRELLKLVKELYKADLPNHFNLQYEDSEFDRIVLHTNDDFDTMLETELSDPSKFVKIYVVEAGDDSVSLISKADISSEDEEEVQNKAPAVAPSSSVETESAEETPKHPEEPTIEEPATTAEPQVDQTAPLNQVLKDMMKSIAKESFFEEVSTIAVLVKELLQAPHQRADADTKPIEKKKLAQKKCNPTEPKAVHNGIICDGCGMHPIVGARYKCTVADDFDLCENCESLGSHPYPLLKIRTEAQRPYKVITVIDEDEVDRLQHLNDLKKMADSTKNARNPKEAEQRKCCRKKSASKKDVKKEKCEEPKAAKAPKKSCLKKKISPLEFVDEEPLPVVQEPTVIQVPQLPEVEQKKNEESPKGEDFDAELGKEINQIPVSVTTNDFMVYKTVCIRNTGDKTWPKESVIRCSNDDSASTVLPEVEAGGEFSTVLIIKSPEQAGKFDYNWRFSYKNEQGENVYFGKPFTTSFEVEAPEVKQAPVEEKQYSLDVLAKAKAVQEIFSDKNLGEICEYIEQVPEKSVDEIVEDYLGGL